MPNNTNGKNSKGKKHSSASTKKVETKKTQPEKKVEHNTEVKETEVKNDKIRKEEKSSSNGLNVSMSTLFKITLCVAIVLLAALIFTAYSKRVPKTSNGKEIIATIKGKKITADDLYDELKKDRGTEALVNIIDKYISDKEVTVTDDDKEYVQGVVDYYKQYAEYYQTDFETFLANYMGLTDVTNENEFFDYVLEDYKKTLAVTKFIADEAKEEDIKNYYNENYSDTLKVRHILIEVDSDAEDADKADKEAYDKAAKLIKELDGTKASKLEDKFKDLAKNNSDDTATYSDGGLIEDVTTTSVVKEFYDAASKLKDGEYTKEPVKSSYGYHIIYKISSTPVEKYEDIKDDVKKAYAQKLLSDDNTLFTKKWDELRKQYKLSIKDDVINDNYTTTIKEATETKTEE